MQMEGSLHSGSYVPSSTQQYETFLAAIPGGILITADDNDFTILFANQGYYELVGYEQEEYVRRFQNIGNRTQHPQDALAAAASAREQLAQTGSFCVKTRLHHKQKGFIWAHFNGRRGRLPDQTVVVYIVVIDISEQVDAQRRLEKERTLNELLGALSGEAFFDCDLLTGAMRCSRDFAEKLGVAELSPDYRETLHRLGLPLAEYLSDPNLLMLHAMGDVFEDEVQLTLTDGRQLWYSCHFHVLKDDQDTPVRMIGQLSDITRHKNQLDELTALAQRDQLTGLYHKAATEGKIKEALRMRREQDAPFALLIVDVDNFKNVNDRLGHLYGDAVLTQLAEHLEGLFRPEDVVGRIGGDEFFVFLKNYGSTDSLKACANEICAQFHKTYSEGDAFVTISASIGISICTRAGQSFDSLYREADAALYDAKARGKNTFSFYTSDLNADYISTRTEIDSNALQKSFKNNRIEYVFRMLYNSETPVSSIQAVLQLVTESFGFSRGYIFETSQDGLWTSNTFEWCAKGINPEIQNLQNLPIEGVSTANAAFESTGMFVLESLHTLPEIERNILEPQGIRSMFQFGIKDMGRLMGFIGFDDCVKERIPTDTEMDEICTVCHVLATFLLRHRSSEREVLHHQAIETVMDNMNSLAYVIQPQSYRVLYENRNVRMVTGRQSVGEQCHLAYRGNPEPCEDCPMRYIGPNSDRHIMEIYNQKFDMYVRTEANLIDWTDGKKACLVCSMDISEYKRPTEE